MTIYVNECFKPPSSSQAATRSTFASLVECHKQLTRVTLRRLVYVFTASVFSSNLLFHCFVRDFIQYKYICNVLNETEIVAIFRKARLGGVAINYLGFWITILANTDCLLSKLFFSQSMFWHYRYSKCHIQGSYSFWHFKFHDFS